MPNRSRFAQKQEEKYGRHKLSGELYEARLRIEELEGRSERLRVALGWFVADGRFRVGVGGNPNVVEPMIEEARRIYENAQDEI